MKLRKRVISIMLCLMLAMSMAVCGCKREETEPIDTSAELQVVGKGETKFEFYVIDDSGNQTSYEVHTDKKTVGEALLECKLIDGEEGQYGLYVKTVNGITADYDKDGKYWAFYVNEEYGKTGVDSTEIKAGEKYSFKVEK